LLLKPIINPCRTQTVIVTAVVVVVVVVVVVGVGVVVAMSDTSCIRITAEHQE